MNWGSSPAGLGGLLAALLPAGQDAEDGGDQGVVDARGPHGVARGAP